MATTMNKARLLDEINSNYATLETALASLKQEQMTTPVVTGDWSIKDILAHLAAWHRYLLIHLQAAMRNEEPADKGFTGGGDTDTMNARFYEQNKIRSLDDVQADFRATYRQVVEAVQALSDEDLFDPQRFAWMKGNALWELVAGNTYEHYQEHLQSIQEWLSKAR
ncbi:MAG TPA: ClbS/DfsB family four-helix bundle protein [Ktedonobacteraceae bacterium]|nr:ClbS/DfsB family four-helix bundle protein [Ktedonobacteraceae bacterium]